MEDTYPIKYLMYKFDSLKGALVLLKIMLFIDKVNIVKGTPAELASNWGISLRQFAHGVKELKQLGLVRKYAQSEYMLNPGVNHNSKTDIYHELMDVWENQTSKGLYNKCN